MDSINIGFATGAETIDGKIFVANGVALVDVKDSSQAKTQLEQTGIAQTLVVNHFPTFVGTVSSTQITNDYRTFSKNLESSLRDRLDGEGLSLKILMIFNHRLE